MNIFTLMGTILVDNTKANESISKTGKEADGLTSKIGSALKTMAGIGTAVVGAVGAGAAALYGMASNAAEATDRIDKMSAKVGVSKTAFQEWDYIMGQNGMSIDKMEVGMKSLTSKMDAAQSGNKSALASFDALNLSWEDGNGKLKSQEQMMNESILALADMENGTEKAKLATELFGKAGVEMMPMLNGGAEGIKELKERAHELGLVMSDEAVDAGVVFGDTMDDLKSSFSAIGTKVGVEVMPIIQKCADWILSHMPEIQSVLSFVFSTISTVVSSAIQVVQWLVQAFGKLFDSNTELGSNLAGTWESIKSMFSETVANIGAMIEAFVNLAVAFWQEWGSTITTYLSGVFEVLKIIFQTAFNVINDIFLIFKNLFSGNWSELWSSIDKLLVDILNGIANAVSVWLNTIINLIASIGEKIKSKWSEIWQDVKLKTSEIIDGIKTAVSDKINEVKEKVIEMGTDLITSLKELPEKALQEGKNFIDGFISGIGEKVTEAINKVKNFGNNIIDTFKLTLDSHSPSRKTKAEGINTIDGFIVGVDERSETALKHVQDFCDEVLGNFQNYNKKYMAENNSMNEKEREIYNEKAKVLKEYIEDKKYYSQLSLEEELYIYEKLQEASKGYADETTAIEKEIYRVKNELREEETTKIKDTADEWVSIIEGAYGVIFNRIETETNAELEELQAKLDLMDSEDKKNKYNETDSNYKNKIASLEEELNNTDDYEKASGIRTKLEEEEKKYKVWLLEEERKAERLSIQDKMKEVRKNAADEKAEQQKQMESIVDTIRTNQVEQIELVRKGAEGQIAISAIKTAAINALNSRITTNDEDSQTLQNINLEEAQNKAISILREKSQEFTSASQDISDSIMNAVGSGIDNTDDIEKKNESLWLSVRDTAVSGWDIICQWFNKNVGKPIDIILSTKDKYLNSGKVVFNAFWDGMREVWDNIEKWVNQKSDDIRQQLEVWRESQAEMSGGSSSGGIDGSHKTGLSYVAYDGYIAELHEGEGVLTKEENKAYREGNAGGGGVTVIQNIYSPEQNPREQQKRAARELKKLGLEV